MVARHSCWVALVALALDLVLAAPTLSGQGKPPRQAKPPRQITPDVCSYSVAVTPKGSLVTEPTNTSNLQAAFTVTNTGTCADDFSFTAGATGPITISSSSPTSQNISAGQHATVTVTYSTGSAGSGTVTMNATGNIGPGESDNGSYNVTVQAPAPAVSVTPHGGTAPTRTANTSGYNQVFTVTNTGNVTTAYTLTCSGTNGLTCSRLSVTSVTLAAGANTLDTAYYSVGSAGTDSLKLSASGSGASDLGSYIVPVVLYQVSVTPKGGSVAWVAGTNGATSSFTVTNTGSGSETYTFSATGTNGVSSITLSATSATLASNQSTTVTATYNVAQPPSPTSASTLTLNAVGGTGGDQDNGSYNVSIYAVSVAPHGGTAPNRAANTGGYNQTFTVTNLGNVQTTYTLSCGGSSNVTCSRLSATSLTLAAGAAATDTAYYSVGGAGTGTLSLTAAGSGASDVGSYTIPVVTYQVSVTPKGGSATWGAGTNGATSSFTVTNTGTGSDTYTFSAAGTNGVTSISLSATSATLTSNQSTTVTATYNVTGPTAPGPGMLTLSAVGGTGGEQDNGSYNVTITTVAVTPHTATDTVKATLSQALTYQVDYSGANSATITVTCVASANETCGSVSPNTINNVTFGVTTPVTMNFAAGAGGTSGTVTLKATPSLGGPDSGVTTVTNSATSPYAATLSPHTQAATVARNTTGTVTFQLQNSGTSTNSYTLACTATGADACSTISPPRVSNLGPGATATVSVSFAAGAGSSGSIALQATGSGGGSDNGTYTVTNAAPPPPPPPPPTYNVAVTTGKSLLTAGNATVQLATWIVRNTGTGTDTYSFTCTVAGSEYCLNPNNGPISPAQVTLAGGAQAAVSMNWVSGGGGTSGSVALYATSTHATSAGTYNVNNVNPPSGGKCPQVPVFGTTGAGPNVLDVVEPAASTVCYAVSVTALSGNGSGLSNTGGYVALFDVQNTGASKDVYTVSCRVTGAATSCSVNDVATGVPLQGNTDATVGVTYSLGAPGNGTVTVTATGGNVSDSSSASITVTAQAPARSVAVTPKGQTISVSAAGTQALTFLVQNNGSIGDTFALTCITTGNETCGSVTPSPLSNAAPGVQNAVTVNFTAGALGTNGTVWLRAVGNAGEKDSGSFAVTNTGFVAAAPHGGSDWRLASYSYTDTFTVTNPGTGSTTYTLTAACSGSAIASSCVPAPTSLTLGNDASGIVTVSYTTGVTAGATGQVKVFATASGVSSVQDSAWATVTLGTAQPPVIDVSSVNPGSTRERRLCLTSAVADAAAAECGDLRLVHAFPETRTLNRVHTPTLFYSSAEARPYPLVAANVTLPATAARPDTVAATLTVNSTIHGSAKWPGADWSPGSVRRIVVADTTASLGTGAYTYTLAVTNQWNGVSSQGQSVSGQFALVDRRQSVFGAGWWLAGVERLYPATMVWVGGDGSTRQYTAAVTQSGLTNCSTGQPYSPTSPNVYAAPNIDRPDTVKFDGGCFTRYLAHGLRVVFDAQGRHRYTIDRLADTTTFTWSNSSDTLASISLARTNLTYQFSYTSGSRWVVTAPSNSQTRADTGTIVRGRLTAIGGPDNTRVAFGYQSGTDSTLIAWRADRRAYPTNYSYDGAKRFLESRLDLGGAQTPIVQLWQSLESLGYATAGTPHAVDTALAYTRYIGPRTDVLDTAAFWLDRFSAPRRIVNALGYQTTITRDATWPALPAQVQAPNGFVTQARYDARGNLDTMTAVNPLGDGRNAVSVYSWDPTWDFVTSTTDPTGVVTQFAHDPSNGNRLWQQPGTDPSRRVQFFYYVYTGPGTFPLLRATQYPTSPATRDSIAYDGTLGNLAATLTPIGFRTLYFADAIGQDTLVESPLDSLQHRTVRVRTAYDVVGRDTLKMTFSDSTTDSIKVRQHFDADGHADTVMTASAPDINAIGWMTHVFTFDAAGRKTSDSLGGLAKIPFRYDLAGNLINGGRQGADDVTVSYDALNRVTQRIASDTSVFTYDAGGNLTSANNSTAKIARTYYPDNALNTDTLRISTDFRSSQDFTKHVYGQQFGYDLGGRRLWAKHPLALAPPGPDSVSYAYEAIFGNYQAITAFGNRYGFAYDSGGRPTRVTRLAQQADSVPETIRYDADGRVVQRVIQPAAAPSPAFQESPGYDARGRVTNEPNSQEFTSYGPLGAMVLSNTYAGSFGYVVDALGNRHQGGLSSGANPDFYFYSPGIGQLQHREEHRGSSVDTTYYNYSPDGRLYLQQHRHSFTLSFGGSNYAESEHRDTYSTYDGNWRLIGTQFVLDTVLPPPNDPNYQLYTSTEAYRYDALGRRVYTREVRAANCPNKDKGSGCLSTLTHTVWDGDQVLYELRGPGDSASSALETDPPASDTLHGVVGYLHAGGIDKPLALWKLNQFGADTVLPYAKYRGAFTAGTCATSACQLPNMWFPESLYTTFGEPPIFPNGPPSWHGSILEGNQDASGYQYRRNRYYDPSSGRFTQTDPVGLGGGLNLYGFGGGDPVNFSDPFGLCPIPSTDCPFGYYTKFGFKFGLAAGVAAGLVEAVPTGEVAAPVTVATSAGLLTAVGTLGGLGADLGNLLYSKGTSLWDAVKIKILITVGNIATHGKLQEKTMEKERIRQEQTQQTKAEEKQPGEPKPKEPKPNEPNGEPPHN